MAPRIKKIVSTLCVMVVSLSAFAQNGPPPPPPPPIGLGVPVDENIIVIIVAGMLFGVYSVLSLRKKGRNVAQ